MRMKKMMVAVITMVLLMTSIFSSNTFTTVQAATDSVIEFSNQDFNLNVKPGETTRITLPITSTSKYIDDPVVAIEDYSKDSPFYFTKPNMATGSNLPVHVLSPGQTIYVDFDVRVKETASIGSYPVYLNFKGKSIYDGGDVDTNLTFNLKVLEEKSPTQLTITGINYETAIPGKNITADLTIKNEGEIASRNTYLVVEYGDVGISNRYTATNIKVGDIGPGQEQKLSLPMQILPTAVAGSKKLIANFSYKDIDGNEQKSNYNFYVDVTVNDAAPNLDIESIDYPNGLQAGNKFTLQADIRNVGEAVAKKISISVDGEGSSAFIKNYLSDGVDVSDIKNDKTRTVSIPLLVTKEAVGDLNRLNLIIKYEDSNGVIYTKVKTLYINVVTPEAGIENVIISNVKQVPAKPIAGNQFEISFDFKNKGSVDITQLKISLGNLTADTFSPVNAEPYIYIDKIPANGVKTITIPLKASKDIKEGLHKLAIKYEYKDGVPGTVDIPILDVKNDLGSKSKPKLIISKYETNLEELRAGSIFNFTFEIRNTHASVAAKNITVKVASKESGDIAKTEVFNVTQGSNSFFISKIDPGETLESTLELKIKSDAATNTYPIYIIIEYEYDGIEPNATTGQIGEIQTEELTLQVVENSRPVVDYVSVNSYDGIIVVNNPATVSFEFYNMGKSMLNNVIATVEGDFSNSSGNMFFMGNVLAGDRSYAEFEVIPTVEGMAKGVVRITFEDSNGEEVVYTKDFERMVNGVQEWDSGMNNGGDMEVLNPSVPVAKKAIMPKWLFIIMEVVIFLLFLPITKKIIIAIYRNKLRKQEESNY